VTLHRMFGKVETISNGRVGKPIHFEGVGTGCDAKSLAAALILRGRTDGLT
jgi:hypothetical protein